MKKHSFIFMYKEFVSEAASAVLLAFVAAVAPVLGTITLV